MTWWDPKECAVCGKPAIYIRPPEGRCRAHKDVTTEGSARLRAQTEAKSDLRMLAERATDKRILKAKSLKASPGSPGRLRCSGTG